MYVLYGWETGIYNEFRHLRYRGLSKAQLMELVMFAQLQAGMRGLQLVYNGASRLLVDLPDPARRRPSQAVGRPIRTAFKAGLDLSTRELTDADRTNVIGWYERTIGYVPKSVQFAMDVSPRVLQVAPRALGSDLPDAAQAGRAVHHAAPAHADRQSGGAARGRPAGQGVGHHARMDRARADGQRVLHRLRRPVLRADRGATTCSSIGRTTRDQSAFTAPDIADIDRLSARSERSSSSRPGARTD